MNKPHTPRLARRDKVARLLSAVYCLEELGAHDTAAHVRRVIGEYLRKTKLEKRT